MVPLSNSNDPKDIGGRHVRVFRKSDGTFHEGDVISDTRPLNLPGPDKGYVVIKWPDGGNGSHMEWSVPDSDIDKIEDLCPAMYGYGN
jgi:hypothetical protein